MERMILTPLFKTLNMERLTRTPLARISNMKRMILTTLLADLKHGADDMELEREDVPIEKEHQGDAP